MSTSSEVVLEFNEFSMRYPKSTNWVLNGLNLKINKGECLALVGPSGCGKSTIAKAILQLLPSSSYSKGNLFLSGKDPRKLNEIKLRELRGNSVGLVFQDPMTRLNPLMTIGGHLLDVLKAHQPKTTFTWRKQRAKELLERVGISSNRFSSYPHEFSGGMRQRLAIALAIALKPPLVIADEPTTSLDMEVANKVMNELKGLCEELGSALLLISHDLALAGHWCERMAILHEGKIIEDGESQILLTSPNSSIGKQLIQAARLKEGEGTPQKPQTNIILEVECLRSWHALSSLPWVKSQWLKAVDEISFRLSVGETLGIVGPSGCGKSTLCRALMGLTPIRGGQIKLQGQSLLSLRGQALKRAKKSVQMVFQDPLACLNPKMTVEEAISDPLLIHKLASKSEAIQETKGLLTQVGLSPAEKFQHCLPRELSGGQLQRVAIARAIALKPKVLICDESVSMLDAETQAEVLALLKKLQQELGLAILFITHDLSVATGFCHKIIVLNQGQIIEEGPGEQLLSQSTKLITRKMVNACPRLPIPQ